MAHLYRLFASLRAVKHNRIITIPAGARIQVGGEVRDCGLIEVQYDGDAVTLFAEDLQARSEAMQAGVA